MAAVFPSGIKTFTAKIDLVDTVIASHVNQLQEEVNSVEATLGTGTLTSTWAGTFTTPGSHATVTARLLNIEAGLAEHAGTLSTLGTAGALLASPAFTGVPTAPTASPGTNTTQIATTAFVTAGVAAHAALTATHGVAGALVGTTDTQTLTNKTMSGASNTFSNIPQASVTSLVSDLALKAPLASPALTGVPTAPTAAGATNTTQVATTAFTVGEIATHAAVTATHGATGAVVGTTNVQTLTNKTLVNAKFNGPIEGQTITASAATGTVNIDVITASVLYYTVNASSNFTLNVRGNSGTTLNSVLAVGDSVTTTFKCTNGATPYYPNVVNIDGLSAGVKWQYGAAPSAGNANSVDAYTLEITKTGSGTYLVLGTFAKYA